jgi:hypothetical protein
MFIEKIFCKQAQKIKGKFKEKVDFQSYEGTSPTIKSVSSLECLQ